MQRIFLVLIGALMPAAALAHPSVVPHEHPHAASLLPDLTVLLMAAVVVGTGAIVIAMSRRAPK
jgi:hypothetical protein